MQIRLKEQTGQMWVSSPIDLVTPCDLVKFYTMTKKRHQIKITLYIFEITFRADLRKFGWSPKFNAMETKARPVNN